MKEEQIDFVIPWVDGNDPEWIMRRNKVLVLKSSDSLNHRYLDWGLLRYWFRGVQKFTPWVHKIWFICDQKPPIWLNRSHPKIEIVYHSDYIPAKYLPVFSSHPIELNLHRIKGLSDKFVYFNDDTFILSPLNSDFFFKNGYPRDHAIINPITATELARNGRGSHISPVYLNDIEYMNADYDFHSCVKAHPLKWFHPCYGKNNFRNLLLLPWPRFIGFIETHLPNAFLKSSFEKAWKNDYDILDATSGHPLRDDRDVNQWLIRHQQLADGNFIPRKPLMHCCFSAHEDDERMHMMIRRQLQPLICINDFKPLPESSFKKLRNKIQEDFDTILAEKSDFEV